MVDMIIVDITGNIRSDWKWQKSLEIMGNCWDSSGIIGIELGGILVHNKEVLKH